MKKPFKYCFRHECFIEYGFVEPQPISYSDNIPTGTIQRKFNPKQLRAYKKGLAMTERYLKKMKRLGFKTFEYSEVNEDE